MARKTYSSPKFFELTPGQDPGIILPGSQGTSGDDPQYTWDPNIDPDDIEMLQDLIVAATNEALRKANDESQKLMSGITGGRMPF